MLTRVATVNAAYARVITVTIFALFATLPLTGTFPQIEPALAQNGLQLITADANHDGVIDSATLYMPGCAYLGGGLGSSGTPGYCAHSDFGYFSCPPGDTCQIPLSLVPSGYGGDVWVWMWCANPYTYNCQILRPTPPTVVAVQTYGATYGELSARWWQWLLSIPAAVNPNLDATGANCAQGQYDDVWFLAGAFGGTVTRSCTIPANKPVFFPLINTIAFKPNGNETLIDLRRLAAAFIDTVAELDCSMDGVACFKDPSSFRVRSPSFTVIAPSNGVVPPGKLSVPGNTDSIVSDGYWVLITPPTPGMHVIHVRATTGDGFSLDVTYNLTVQ
jgi:hypothetical protein